MTCCGIHILGGGNPQQCDFTEISSNDTIHSFPLSFIVLTLLAITSLADCANPVQFDSVDIHFSNVDLLVSRRALKC